MDVWAITVAVLRRWYVFFPLLALTLIAAWWVGSRAPEQHEVTATVVLVPGTTVSEIENPYGGIGDTAQVLEIVMGAPGVRDSMLDQGLSADYLVDARSDSRIMQMVVTADTAQRAEGTALALIEGTGQELQTRQAEVGIPESAQIGLQVLQPPTVTGVAADGALRNMAVVGVGGAALSLLAAVLFDDIRGLLRRARRSASEPVDAEPGSPGL